MQPTTTTTTPVTLPTLADLPLDPPRIVKMDTETLRYAMTQVLESRPDNAWTVAEIQRVMVQQEYLDGRHYKERSEQFDAAYANESTLRKAVAERLNEEGASAHVYTWHGKVDNDPAVAEASKIRQALQDWKHEFYAEALRAVSLGRIRSGLNRMQIDGELKQVHSYGRENQYRVDTRAAKFERKAAAEALEAREALAKASLATIVAALGLDAGDTDEYGASTGGEFWQTHNQERAVFTSTALAKIAEALAPAQAETASE